MPESYVPTDHKGLIDFLDKIESEGTTALSDRSRVWEKAIRLYDSGSADKPPKVDRAQFRTNIIAPSARRKGALMTEQRPRLDVQPRTNGLTATAKILRNVITAGWDEHGVQGALEDICTLYAQVLACGFCEIGWNPNADYGMGSIEFSAVDPRQVIVDPSVLRARDINTAQYLRVRSVAPLHVVADLYPAVADELKPCRAITALDDSDSPKGKQGLGGRLAQVARAAMGRGNEYNDPPIPRVELYTYWFTDPAKDGDGNPIYPGGRCVVRANDDVICLKEEFSEATLENETGNPYYDGMWPFEWLDNVPDINSAWGRDEITAARWIQNTFDRIGNTTVETMLVNSKPFVLAPKNTLDNDTINLLTRMKHVVLQYTAGRGEVTRQASPIPTGVYLQLMQMCQGILEYTQGLQDAGGGIPAKGRAEVRSSSMLEGLQSAAQVLVRAEARRLEDFLQRAGQKWISRIFQFMTSDRLMHFSSGENQFQTYEFEYAKLVEEVLALAEKRVFAERKKQAEQDTEEISSNVIPISSGQRTQHTLGSDEVLAAIKGSWREFRFKVIPLSSLASSRMQRVNMLAGLKGQGVPIPDSMIMEELGFDNSADILKKGAEEIKEKMALGIPPPAPPGGKKKTHG